MTSTITRVTFVDTGPEDDAWDPIIIDLLLDEEGNVSRKVPAVGWWGLFSPGDDFYPFVLRSDGRVDFGSVYEKEEDRFGRCNLFDKQIRRGEYVTFWFNEDELCMRAKDFQPLGEMRGEG
jgi:hypothetical protein